MQAESIKPVIKLESQHWGSFIFYLGVRGYTCAKGFGDIAWHVTHKHFANEPLEITEIRGVWIIPAGLHGEVANYYTTRNQHEKDHTARVG